MYDEYAGVEFSVGAAMLYLDGVTDFDRVRPALLDWHEAGAPLLLRAAKDLPKPRVNRTAATADDPETGAFQQFKPRTWAAGLRADIGSLRVSWSFDDDEPPVYGAGVDLLRFADPDHLMLRADLSQHGPRVDSAALLELLHRVADLADPVYGEIVVDRGTPAPGTELDRALRRVASRSEGEGREFLRGYEWVTICPKELASRLGGAAALRAGGAFHEVAELSSGALLLRATETPETYDAVAAQRVAEALNTVLPRA
jgi:hypothetical protein